MAEIWNLSALCRCCLKDGQFTDLRTLLQDSDTNYTTLLQETYNISMDLPLHGASYAICDTCIEDLIRAHNFKVQVVECEQKFHEYCQNELATQCDLKEEVESLYDNVSDDNDNRDFDDFEQKYSDLIEFEDDDVTSDFVDDEKDEDYNGEVIKTKENPKRARGRPKNVKTGRKKLIPSFPPMHTLHPEVQKYVKDEEDKRICTLCNYVYNKYVYSIYAKHLQEEHSIHFEYKCDDCGKIFKNCRFLYWHNLYKHPAVCNDPKNNIKKGEFPCKKCKFKSTTFNKLIYHDRTLHLSDKKFYCDLCDRAFISKHSIRAHLDSVHFKTNIKKNIICEYCGLRLQHISLYNLHRSTVHENLRPFSCDLCPKRFKNGTHLKVHKLRHTGTRPHKCDQCENAFYDTYTLKVHKQTHVAKENVEVVCRICKEVFPRKDALLQHYSLHRSSLKHTCEHCPMRFASIGAKKKHMKRHLGMIFNGEVH